MTDDCRSRTGRKGPYAHYYVQIAPGNQSFVGKLYLVQEIQHFSVPSSVYRFVIQSSPTYASSSVRQLLGERSET